MTPDVVVVGAGIVGCSVAYELAKERLRVVVVERGEIGRESSWAAGGVLTPVHLADYPSALASICLRAQAEYPRFIEELRGGEDPEYRTTGMLFLIRDAEDETAARELEEWMRTHERPVERRPDGLFLPEVAQVRNHRLTRAIAQAATKLGAEFRTGSAVTGFLRVPGRVNGVRTDRGDLQAKTTVLAAGAWSGQEAARLGISLPVKPIKGQILLAQFPLPHIVLHKHHYLIPRADGKVLIGTTAEDVGFDKSVTLGAARTMLEAAATMCPGIEGAPLLASWAGLRPGSPDRLPIIGPVPGWEGLVVATGHFRNGILLGPITGSLVRDIILGREPEELRDFLPHRLH